MAYDPIMNYPFIMRYRPLEEGKHAFYYGVEESCLKDTVLKALQSKERLIEMGQNVRRHVLIHHTFEALAGYILKECMALFD